MPLYLRNTAASPLVPGSTFFSNLHSCWHKMETCLSPMTYLPEHVTRMFSTIRRIHSYASTFVGLVMSNSPLYLLLLLTQWTACALLQNDEVTLCEVARWFMKEYQFVTDGYRLFSALNRLSDSDNGHFNSGPSQKFILRQVKAVDYSLISEPTRKSIFQDKPGYSKDSSGDPILAAEMDVALLMLYGQILYAGRNFVFALSKQTCLMIAMYVRMLTHWQITSSVPWTWTPIMP